MATEEQVTIAAKIYQCRKTAKSIWQEEYHDKISWYINVLNNIEKEENISTLEAVLFASNLNGVKDEGMALVMFMAAAAEIIEPSKN